MVASIATVIRVDAIWLAREPLDIRAGPDTALARVVNRFGEAMPHTAYVFANKRANRMKVLIHDGFGIWLAARRLHQGKFAWTKLREGGAIEQELDALTGDIAKPRTAKRQPKRQALPANLPRTEIHHDPDSTTFGCGCQLAHIGDDISEKLDYEPGSFSVERHIRSKWACKSCETVVQAPVAPHVIDKGIPTTRLLTHVLVSKYADHQPLYRQNQIFQRAGVDIPL